MIRTPLRPLARILSARVRGENPDAIERENLRLRHEEIRDRSRRRAEGRLLLTAAIFVAGFVVIGARMGLLAATEPMEPRTSVGEQIVAERADIVDRNGRILATNMVTNSLYAEMRYLVDPVHAAEELARIFPELNQDRLTSHLTDPNRRFLWIRAQLSPEQEQQVYDIGEPGLLFGPREMRLYPNGSIAAHVLGGAAYGQQGVSAAEIIGTAGIERMFDAELRNPDRADQPLELSLDLTIQAVTTEILSGGMRILNARGASAVLMDARTGEILSLVSLPDFDPNDRPAPALEGDPADSPLFNRAVQGYYELGSVMKIFTVAEALDIGEITPETMIDTQGPIRWGSFSINDFHDYGARQSATDVIVQSSNVGTARIAQAMGADRQRAFLQRLGFLESSPVELSEAISARPLYPENWSELSTMTISFGHGISTNQVQLAAGYASMVNGGRLVHPTLLRQRQSGTLGEQVISRQTSAQIRSMLRQVVQRGTASFGNVPGYAVGGKTGSADKPNPAGGYFSDRVLATFAGIFPAHDPRFVLVVSMDEPVETIGSEARRTAGWTVVPVAAEIIRRTAPLMGMRPQSDAEIELAMQNALFAAQE
jgi:cell division protein FtsI (penicillin-binding protein 3)